MSRLKEKFQNEVTPALMERFNYTSVMNVPKVEKIVLNIGVGEAIQNAKALESAVEDLTVIAGQKPVITKAKKSIANFKLREGMSIGTMVTLRGERMWSCFSGSRVRQDRQDSWSEYLHCHNGKD